MLSQSPNLYKVKSEFSAFQSVISLKKKKESCCYLKGWQLKQIDSIISYITKNIVLGFHYAGHDCSIHPVFTFLITLENKKFYLVFNHSNHELLYIFAGF